MEKKVLTPGEIIENYLSKDLIFKRFLPVLKGYPSEVQIKVLAGSYEECKDVDPLQQELFKDLIHKFGDFRLVTSVMSDDLGFLQNLWESGVKFADLKDKSESAVKRDLEGLGVWFKSAEQLATFVQIMKKQTFDPYFLSLADQLLKEYNSPRVQEYLNKLDDAYKQLLAEKADAQSKGLVDVLLIVNKSLSLLANFLGGLYGCYQYYKMGGKIAEIGRIEAFRELPFNSEYTEEQIKTVTENKAEVKIQKVFAFIDAVMCVTSVIIQTIIFVQVKDTLAGIRTEIEKYDKELNTIEEKLKQIGPILDAVCKGNDEQVFIQARILLTDLTDIHLKLLSIITYAKVAKESAAKIKEMQILTLIESSISTVLGGIQMGISCWKRLGKTMIATSITKFGVSVTTLGFSISILVDANDIIDKSSKLLQRAELLQEDCDKKMQKLRKRVRQLTGTDRKYIFLEHNNEVYVFIKGMYYKFNSKKEVVTVEKIKDSWLKGIWEDGFDACFKANNMIYFINDDEYIAYDLGTNTARHAEKLAALTTFNSVDAAVVYDNCVYFFCEYEYEQCTFQFAQLCRDQIIYKWKGVWPHNIEAAYVLLETPLIIYFVKGIHQLSYKVLESTVTETREIQSVWKVPKFGA